MAAVRHTLAHAVDIVAARAPTRLALASPFQPGRFASFDYAGLRDASIRLAAGLNARFGASHRGPGAFATGGVLVSDLPNVAENLLCQLACNRLGVAFATAKDAKVLAKLQDAGLDVLGAVTADEGGFLAGADLEAHIDEAELAALMDTELDPAVALADLAVGDEAEAAAGDAHAYFNSPSALTNADLLAQGADAAAQLGLTEDDKVCVSSQKQTMPFSGTIL